jgi:hypothetical protein
MYRHKLPPGYVLKSELEAQRLLDEENKVDMEESIDEEARAAYPTPSTFSTAAAPSIARSCPSAHWSTAGYHAVATVARNADGRPSKAYGGAAPYSSTLQRLPYPSTNGRKAFEGLWGRPPRTAVLPSACAAEEG